MSAVLQGWAFSLPLVWARLYTLGLPVHERHERLERIASDVYEQRLATRRSRDLAFAILEVLVCLAGSIISDLSWRFERGHKLRVSAIRAGRPPFPVFVTVLLALAGLVGGIRLSVFHDLPGRELAAIILALLAGPLVGVLGILIARQSLVTGILALSAGSAALAVSAFPTLIAPLAAVVGAAVGLSSILETRHAYRTTPAPGRSAAPTSPYPDVPQHQLAVEAAMDAPDKLERWLSLGAILVLVGLVTTMAHDLSFPFDGTDAEIREWYAEGREAVTYGAFLGGLAGGVGLLLFFGGLYASARRAEGGTGYLSALMLASAAGAAAISMLEATLGASVGMAYAYDDEFKAGGVDTQTVRHISALGFGLLAMSAAAMAVALGALATIVLRTRQVLARWLGWATVAVAVLLLLNFPLFNMPQSLFVLWTLVVAAFRLLRPEAVPSMPRAASPAAI